MDDTDEAVLLKISGEACGPNHEEAGSNPDEHLPISPKAVAHFAHDIVESQTRFGTRIAVVIGGGNIWRGGFDIVDGVRVDSPTKGPDRVESDQMGMMATMVNALALKRALRAAGAVDPRVMSAIAVDTICEKYIPARAVKHLDKDRIVICAAGTGNPFCTTDAAAILRAREMGASRVLKATNVDGVYTADPRRNPDATRIPRLSFRQAVDGGFKVMDQTAFTDAEIGAMPIFVFDGTVKGNIVKAIGHDLSIGTLVGP